MYINKKNLVFYFILLLIIFCLLEFSSFIVVKNLKNSDFLLGTKAYISKHINEEYFTTDKVLFNPYVNHKKNLDFLSNKPNIYIKKKPFQEIIKNSNDLVLIQGDSWAEIISSNKKILGLLKQFGEKNNFSIFNSGTSSYSLSLYIAQLKILNTYYNIYPEYIILIIDQTDLGDDLYRRSYFDHLPNKISINYNEKIVKNIEGGDLNIIKILRLPILYFSFIKKNYDFTYLELISFLKNKILSKTTKTPLILMPLKNGISETQEKLFNSLLEIYFDLAISKNLKKILIVSHPHLNHLNKKYELDISILINNYLKNNKSNKKLHYLDFKEIIKNKKKYKDFFKEGDIFSHLEKSKYEEYFYPIILDKLNDIK